MHWWNLVRWWYRARRRYRNWLRSRRKLCEAFLQPLLHRLPLGFAALLRFSVALAFVVEEDSFSLFFIGAEVLLATFLCFL